MPIKHLRRNAIGGIIKYIKLNHLTEAKIALPPLDDQFRIAHLLSKVEGLIAQRKQHLQQLDNLLKSIFVEIFGFRDETYTQWTIDKLTSHTEIVSGITKGKKYKAEDLIEIPYMRVANVQDGHFILDEVKVIAVTQKEIDQYKLRRGDLLLTEGGDPDKLGRGTVWEEQIKNCIHQNHIFRVRINDQTNLNPYYLSALVSSSYGKAYFLKSAKQTTGIASINSTQLKNFPTVIPHIDLQNQFATIVKKVEGIKTRYQQSLTELENLYGALSQQAFKGELDLSRVPLQPITESFETQHDTQPAPPAITADENPNAIQLPAPTDIKSLTNAEERVAIIRQWLEVYLAQLDIGAPFLPTDFLMVAQQRVEELLQDETPELSVAAYDQLKEWVFQALESDRLIQTYDVTHNRVQIVAAKD